jgi:hypothetical protein
MRQHQSTLRPATVHAYAQQLLQTELELRDYKQAVPAPLLASVLLLAACWQTSLSAACLLVAGTPSHESVRKAMHACLPPRPRDLLARLLAAWRRTLPPHLRHRPLVFVLDLHQRPYYGKPTRGSTRGQKKKSTRKSFTYTTLAALSPEGRFTIGLLPVRPFMRPTTLLTELFRHAADAGLSVAYLLADKEFYSGEAIAWLQRRNIPFVVPAVRQGKQGTGNSYLFQQATPVGWYEYTWESPLRKHNFKEGKRSKKGSLTVTVRMCVARHPKKEEARLVYACWGISKWPPAAVVQAYRRRFGIEVQYRQMGQCLAVTNSRNERVRLLLVGVALLLCNLWAYLHSEVFAEGALGERQLRLSRLRLRTLITALAEAIVTILGGLVSEWPTQHPLPPELAHLENAQ